MKTLGEIKQLMAGCSAMAIPQTGTIDETPFGIRQLQQERIAKEMMIWCAKRSSAELTE